MVTLLLPMFTREVFALKTVKGVTKIGLVVVAFPLLRVVANQEDIPGGLVFLTLLSFVVVALAAYLAYRVLKSYKSGF